MKKAFLHLKNAVLPALLALLLSIAGLTNALAQTFTVGDLNYTINDDGATVTLIGHVDGFSGELVIPESVELYEIFYPVTAIGDGAFEDCGLTGSLVIPNSVTRIGWRAFAGTGIISVTFGNSLSQLIYGAFEYCNNLVEVTIPSSVTYIETRVFGGCSNITTLNYYAIWAEGCVGGGWSNWFEGTSLNTVNIGEEVQRIPCDFLNDVANLPINQIILPESVTCIAWAAFSHYSGSVNIPNSVITIEGYAFNECAGLTGTLNLPETLTSIGERAFFNCTNLTGPLTIPNNVHAIGEYAFSGCTNLSGTLTLGVSLQSIYQYAFFGFMNNVTEIQIYAMTPPYLGSSVFLGSNAQMPVYVPCGTLEAYQNATGWISFANIQEANPCQWEITAIANPSVGGTVSGGGTFVQGTSCTLTATAIGDFEFASWTENGVVVSTEAVYTFTVESNRDLVANFTNPNYIVFVDPNVEARCVQLWDTDGDGFFSYDEAAAVTDLNLAFNYRGITSFNELQYFTGLTFLHDYEFDGCGNLASIVIPESVTSIGYCAFEYCHSLNSITIPESVTYISFCIFYDSGLTTLNYNATNCSVNNWLCGCSLTNLTIGDNVQVIPDNFVSGQSNLAGELVIPESVTSIGNSAFENCSGFTGTLTLPASLTSIGGSAFANCSGFTGTLTLPASLTSIGGSAFTNCSGFTGTLTLPATLTSIEGSTFNGCSGFTGSLTIPDNVTSIGGSAFANCSGFNGTLTLPATLTSIEGSAFNGCSGFTGSLTIPDNVTYIGESAFKNCSGFTTLTIGSGLVWIDYTNEWDARYYTESAFYGCTGFTTLNYNAINCPRLLCYDGNWYEKSVFSNCTSLITLNIGENVQSLPTAAFSGTSFTTINFNATNCVSNFNWYTAPIFRDSPYLTTLNIGENVQTIPERAFMDCGFVGNLVLPESLTTINHYAFCNCSGFTGNLTIPESVTTIGERAFYGCSGFTGELVLSGLTTSIGNYAFYGCSGFTGNLLIPNSVSYIGSQAFYGCSSFTGNLLIPNSVSHIGSRAFNGCSGMEGTLTIGHSVTEIGYAAFNNTALTTLNYEATQCNSIDEYGGENASVFYNFTTVDFGDNVESIPYRAFYGCANLTGNLILPNSLAHIGDQAFYNCYGLESLMLNNSLETIGSEAFRNCGGLKGELILPEALLSVGNNAFTSCDEISTITYNAIHCTEMGNAQSPVFYDCASIAHINIGENVQSIPNYAFKRCSTVVDMRVGAVTPPVIASSTFGTVSRSIPVSVPYGSGDAYRSAQYWEEFFNINEDYSPNPFTYHWNVNPHQFAGNMTVTGIIQIEGVEQAIPSLEIGAFCNGECRGRQLLTYYPQVDRYLVFLMLYGDDGDVFNFRLFDHGAGQELTAGCTSVIAFETDATIGSFSNPYVFNFTNVQISEFTEGWSWWSTYIEMAGIDGLSMLESGLGTNGLVIKSQSDGYTEYYDDYDLWYGSLGSINNESSYMVKTSVPCTVTMPGTTALPSQHPITVDANGWTWIGYPVAYDMDINAALEPRLTRGRRAQVAGGLCRVLRRLRMVRLLGHLPARHGLHVQVHQCLTRHLHLSRQR